ncbi:MAG TPA: galactokinase [Anditalea sp.]|nr:galactokinase [Anditalea sp.]
MVNDSVSISFFHHFEKKPSFIVQSPGRINLIGEHTDYNHGFVLPAAINLGISLAIAPNDTQTCNIYSTDYKETFSFTLDRMEPSDGQPWANYIMGVVNEFQKAGKKLSGFDCAFGGDIPIGSGLSSSAALECGIGFALDQLYDLKLKKWDLIKMAQKAEHNFAGVQCGIMDQFAVVQGKKDHFIRLDCNSLEFEYFPFKDSQFSIVLCNSMVKHALVDSEYNKRRQECESGVEVLRNHWPSISSLRDASLDQLEQIKSELDPIVYNRCRYVLEENERVLQAGNDLHHNDLPSVGKKLYQSHEGLSKLYEVSCPELDFLVESTIDIPQVLGSRMMGGGFGGCTINLVENSFVDKFEGTIRTAYKEKFNLDLEIYRVSIEDGVGKGN